MAKGYFNTRFWIVVFSFSRLATVVQLIAVFNLISHLLLRPLNFQIEKTSLLEEIYYVLVWSGLNLLIF